MRTRLAGLLLGLGGLMEPLGCPFGLPSVEGADYRCERDEDCIVGAGYRCGLEGLCRLEGEDSGPEPPDAGVSDAGLEASGVADAGPDDEA